MTTSNLPGFGGATNQVRWPRTRFEARTREPEALGNTGSNRVNQENRDSRPSQQPERADDVNRRGPGGYAVEQASRAHGALHEPGLPGLPGLPQQERGIEQTELYNQPGLTGHPPGLQQPDDRCGPAEPLSPPSASLVRRLAAAGATVREWDGGDQSQVELPAGIPVDLLREVEARGWRIIPGGRANPEAEHDSWLAGVPIAELER